MIVLVQYSIMLLVAETISSYGLHGKSFNLKILSLQESNVQFVNRP